MVKENLLFGISNEPTKYWWKILFRRVLCYLAQESLQSMVLRNYWKWILVLSVKYMLSRYMLLDYGRHVSYVSYWKTRVLAFVLCLWTKVVILSYHSGWGYCEFGKENRKNWYCCHCSPWKVNLFQTRVLHPCYALLANVAQ